MGRASAKTANNATRAATFGNVSLIEASYIILFPSESRLSAIHPSRRLGRAKDVARRAGAAGLIYIRMKLDARAALTG
jgi:hypothetical protein